jgi:DNA-binding response OmpR family regulator
MPGSRHLCSDGPILTVGDLMLDTGARSARRGERTIDLTSREYAVLEYLMRNGGQVVRRAELARRISGISRTIQTPASYTQAR